MHLQPYDRATGNELSPQQQEDCQSSYTIIKAYIDAVESDAESALPWSRKKLRCSTTELLDSIRSLANEIGQKEREGTHGNNRLGSVSRAHGKQDLDTQPENVVIDPQFYYQQAVNLLHELVGRFADVGSVSGNRLSSELLEDSRVTQGFFVPGSASNTSDTSAGFSNLPTSRTSYITSDSARTGSSRTSGDLDQVTIEAQTLREQLEKRNQVAFEIPLQEANATGDEVKKKATNDWVLEYLRGGWLANSPAAIVESTVSPIFPMTEDSSPVGSFSPLQRADSDEVSTYSEGATFRRIASSSLTARPTRSGRPIPTMASRFRDKVGHEVVYAPNIRSSAASGPEHFRTPTSIMSGATVFCTPDSGSGNLDSVMQVPEASAWNVYLREKGLIPNPFEEMDWSGRGQHAEFEAIEEPEIPLKLEKALGHSASALVESVRCRRIRLARKTVEVSRRLKKEEVMKEVEHLQRLKHSHIIRVVGTYTLPRKLSILLYPVADHTLDQFLESTQEDLLPEERSARLYSISTFLRCLAKALAYIHENAMKHMDIKPKNLLVRDMRNSTICNQGQYKIYIADFGIARSYRSVDDCNTESPTAYTKMYAAPEVVAQERRDQKADIFSLGAVYAEMLAVLADEDQETSNLGHLLKIRESDTTDRSYQAHASTIQTWLRGLSITTYGFESDSNHSHITELVARMLSINPAERPPATTIVNNIPFLAFCCDVNGGSEPFEAADRPASRQLYDRAFEISEADLRYFRCMVDGCVKVYWSREKLEYHRLHGHGEHVDSFPSSDKLLDALTLEQIDQGTTLPYGGSTNNSVSRGFDKELHKELTQNLRWS
ncbi:kinase-like protein [Melanomma pulvis-pyrius CBS 109.77]|uniref:Kinase-like protein n=1 Tax=Melanomma pulvis-pyrius CBS 109.77 TaxID=1314802 RepID=A0A6A6WPS5_9PLEO|nr:kinase-like protein [Melanomma pulvis-pyrius CBS 109.77]